MDPTLDPTWIVVRVKAGFMSSILSGVACAPVPPEEVTWMRGNEYTMLWNDQTTLFSGTVNQFPHVLGPVEVTTPVPSEPGVVNLATTVVLNDLPDVVATARLTVTTTDCTD